MHSQDFSAGRSHMSHSWMSSGGQSPEVCGSQASCFVCCHDCHVGDCVHPDYTRIMKRKYNVQQGLCMDLYQNVLGIAFCPPLPASITHGRCRLYSITQDTLSAVLGAPDSLPATGSRSCGHDGCDATFRTYVQRGRHWTQAHGRSSNRCCEGYAGLSQ
jgi:hypothetical protein